MLCKLLINHAKIVTDNVALLDVELERIQFVFGEVNRRINPSSAKRLRAISTF
jgi:hypothetical protein